MSLDLGAVIIDSVAFISIFGWPVGLAAVLTRHKQKMKELEYKAHGSPAMIEEVASLRREMAQLRETTTKFDMSYDAALDRLERRMDRVESVAVEQPLRTGASYGVDPVELPLRRS